MSLAGFSLETATRRGCMEAADVEELDDSRALEMRLVTDDRFSTSCEARLGLMVTFMFVEVLMVTGGSISAWRRE